MNQLLLAHARKGIGKEREEGSKRGEEGMQGERREKRGEEKTMGDMTCHRVMESITLDFFMRTDEFIESWVDWIEYRIECGRRYRWAITIRSFRRMMKFCESIGPERAARAIDRSIQLGYRGIFEDRIQAQRQQPRKLNCLGR
jgi:hypothetical protein